MKPISLLIIAALLVSGCQQASVETSHGTSEDPLPGASQHVESTRRQFKLKDLQRVTLKANGHEIPAWVMDTDAKRQEGMMWLVDQDVKADDGMIFVFPEAKPEGFWMENTILPLDIIFISANKKVLNVQKGKPYDETNLPSKGAAQYVLEMKQGAAERLGLKPGTNITIPNSVKSK